MFFVVILEHCHIENSRKISAKDYVVSWIPIKKLNQHLYILHMHRFVAASWFGHT